VSCGVPLTVTTSLNTTWIEILLPIEYVPLVELEVTYETVGTSVSYSITVVKDAVLLFPAASVNLPVDTESQAKLTKFAYGVNTTVYEVPEPANDEKVPPLAEISETTKLVDASDKVKVNVDVSPDFNKVELAVIEIVGA
jgi:hypothetical protein